MIFDSHECMVRYHQGELLSGGSELDELTKAYVMPRK